MQQEISKFQQHYEAACELLGRSKELPDVTGKTEIVAGREIAGHMLDVIIDARNLEANEGKPWVADLADTTQKKYHPLFVIIDDSTAPRGFRLSYYGFVYDYVSAGLGARHACKNLAIARQMGDEYHELYKAYKS